MFQQDTSALTDCKQERKLAVRSHLSCQMVAGVQSALSCISPSLILQLSCLSYNTCMSNHPRPVAHTRQNVPAIYRLWSKVGHGRMLLWNDI